jgi:hypothetical protein
MCSPQTAALACRAPPHLKAGAKARCAASPASDRGPTQTPTLQPNVLQPQVSQVQNHQPHTKTRTGLVLHRPTAVTPSVALAVPAFPGCYGCAAAAVLSIRTSSQRTSACAAAIRASCCPACRYWTRPCMACLRLRSPSAVLRSRQTVLSLPHSHHHSAQACTRQAAVSGEALIHEEWVTDLQTAQQGMPCARHVTAECT